MKVILFSKWGWGVAVLLLVSWAFWKLIPFESDPESLPEPAAPAHDISAPATAIVHAPSPLSSPDPVTLPEPPSPSAPTTLTREELNALEARYGPAEILEIRETAGSLRGTVRRTVTLVPEVTGTPLLIEQDIFRPTDGREPMIFRGSSFAADRLMISAPSHEDPPLTDAEVRSLPGVRAVRPIGPLAWSVEIETVHDRAELQQVRESILDRVRSYLEVEPDYVYYTQFMPNDPLFSGTNRWPFLNPGPDFGFLSADIDGPGGWEVATSAADQIVAVIDTGIRLTHEDLAANLWVNPGEIAGNGIDNDGNGYIDDRHGVNLIHRDQPPMDDSGHGTHVAGIIGAVGNNGIGTTGVAWEIQLMAIKALNSQGFTTASTLVEAVAYAVDNGAHIINASWGGPNHSEALFQIFKLAGEAGIFTAAAAGNNGRNLAAQPMYPAAFPLWHVIAVGASSPRDARAPFSNYGFRVDVSAPGAGIFSTLSENDRSYGLLSGTSMAAPFVAGTIALMRQHNPILDARSLSNQFANSHDIVDSLRDANRTGARLNLRSAILGLGSEPINDDFADAFAMRENRIEISGFLGYATRENNEPQAPSSQGRGTQWYTWTPSYSGELQIRSLQVDTPDFLLVLWEGDSLDGLTLRGETTVVTDPEPSGPQTLQIEADVPLAIALEPLTDSPHPFAVELLIPPSNDRFAEAASLEGESFQVRNWNHGATAEQGEPDHRGVGAERSLWWRWNAPTDGIFRVQGQAIGFPLRLASYQGESLDSLAVANAEIYSTTPADAIEFAVTQGEEYLIVLDTFRGLTGEFQLSGSYLEPPVLLRDLQDLNAPQRSNVVLSVQVGGTGRFDYEWYHNGALILNVTTNRLEFTNLQPNQGGLYEVVVRNAAGSVTSRAALLEVTDPMVEAAFFTPSQSLLAGQDATFRIALHGSAAAATYQWFKDGNPINGANESRLLISNVKASDRGLYSVEVRRGQEVYRSPPSVMEVSNQPFTGWIDLATRNQRPIVDHVQVAGDLAFAYRRWDSLNKTWDPSVFVSTNGSDWKELQLPPQQEVIYQVGYAWGKYILAGGSVVLTSSDGKSWESFPIRNPDGSAINFPTIGFFRMLVGGNTVLLHHPGSGTVAHSTDGKNWTTDNTVGLQLSTYNSFSDGERFYFIKNNISYWVTTDGKSWEFIENDDFARSLMFFNGYFWDFREISSGQIFRRTRDGDWKEFSYEGERPMSSVIQASGRLAFLSSNFLMVSENGLDWTPQPRPVRMDDSQSLRVNEFTIFKDRLLLADESAGLLSFGVGETAYDPGLFFHTRPSALGYARGYFYFAGHFGPLGRIALLRTSDGANFETLTTPVLPNLSSRLFTTVSEELILLTTNTALASPDGVSWEVVAEGIQHDLAAGGSAGIVTATTQFGGWRFSPNGRSWETVSGPGIAAVHALTFGDGRFIAVGMDQIAVSTNGRDWNVFNKPADVMVAKLAAGNGNILMASFFDNGRDQPVTSLRLSNNGQNWTTVPWDSTQRIRDLLFHEGKFYILTDFSMGISTNGSNWEFRHISRQTRLEQLIVGGEIAFATADQGVMLKSAGRMPDLPAIDFVDPFPGLVVTSGSTIRARVAVRESDRAIRRIALYHGDRLVGLRSGEPWQWEVTLDGLGSHFLRAEAEDTSGVKYSTSVTIETAPYSHNTAPLGVVSLPDDVIQTNVGLFAYPYYSENGEAWVEVPRLGGGDQNLHQAGDILYMRGTHASSIQASTPEGWRRIEFPDQLSGQSRVSFAGGQYFLATSSRFFRSTDGYNWSEVLLPPEIGPILQVAGDDRKWVGRSGSGAVFSDDGINWQLIPNFQLDVIAYGNGVFLGAGTRNGQRGYHTSFDGRTWERTASSAASFRNFEFKDGRFLDDSNRYSYDGSQWQWAGEPLSAQVGDVRVYQEAGTIFLARSVAGGPPERVDFLSAIQIPAVVYESHEIQPRARSLTAFQGRFVLLASFSWYHNSYFYILSSTDGLNWRQDFSRTVGTPGGSHWIQATVADGRLFAVNSSEGYVEKLPGGKWLHRDLPEEMSFHDRIEYSDGRWFFFNSGNHYLHAENPDGPWTKTDLPQVNRRAVQAFEGGVAVFSNDYQLLITNDNVTFNPIPGLPDNFPSRIFKVGDTYYLSGVFGSANFPKKSTDLINWLPVPGIPESLSFLDYQKGEFLATAGTDLYRSPDGVNWTQGHTLSNPRSPVVKVRGGYMVLADGRRAYFSRDGMEWTSFYLDFHRPNTTDPLFPVFHEEVLYIPGVNFSLVEFSMADLAVRSAQYFKGIYGVSNTLRTRLEMENTGEWDLMPRDDVRIDFTLISEDGATRIGLPPVFRNTPRLEPGHKLKWELETRIPANTPAGEYLLHINVDSERRLVEMGRSNNYYQSTKPTILIPEKKLHLEAVGGGDVRSFSETEALTLNTRVDVAAFPDPEFAFSGWSGDAASGFGPQSLRMDTDKSLIAHFVRLEGPLEIEAQPRDLRVAPGTPALFEIHVSGPRPIRYQWFHDGELVQDGEDPLLHFASVSEEHVGTYHVVVSIDGEDPLTSDTARLTVTREVAPDVSGLFGNPVDFGEGWFRATGYGVVYLPNYPWAHFPGLGWVYLQPTGFESFWFHRPGVGWLWSSSRSWPYLWHPGDENWVYLHRDSRSLYHFTDSTWRPLPTP